MKTGHIIGNWIVLRKYFTGGYSLSHAASPHRAASREKVLGTGLSSKPCAQYILIAAWMGLLRDRVPYVKRTEMLSPKVIAKACTVSNRSDYGQHQVYRSQGKRENAPYDMISSSVLSLTLGLFDTLMW